MNTSLKGLLKKKQDMSDKYRTHKTTGNHKLYKRARNTATLATQAAKYGYEKVAIDAANTKYFWANVRPKTTVKETIMKLKTMRIMKME